MKISERDKERDCIKYVLMWLWVFLPVSHVQILMNIYYKAKGKGGLGVRNSGECECDRGRSMGGI